MAASSPAAAAAREVRIADGPATSRPVIEIPPVAYLIESKRSAPPGSERRKRGFASADELAEHLKLSPVQSDEERLYIIEGLPIEFVQVFGSHFDVDPEVFDSHAVRKSNRLSSAQRNVTSSSGRMQTFALDYPELIIRASPVKGDGTTVKGDLMLPCNTTEIVEAVHQPFVSHPGLDINYCHITLLCFESDTNNNKQHINPYEVSNTNSESPVLAALQALPEERRRWNPARKDEAHLCFTEEVVDSIISSSSPLVFEETISFLTDLVLPRWRTAFDEFSFNTTIPWSSFYETVQQMYNLLNSNFYMHKTKTMRTARHHEIAQQTLWIDLLTGIKGIAKLRGMANMAGRTVMVENNSDDDESDSDTDEDDSDNYSRCTGRSRLHVRGGDLDVETKQSINRVTYLGGVLLPFSIVAAIFSMGDTYSPGGSHFFIFWVIAIPICCITTAVIYADSIRRMTVEQFASQYGAVIKEDKMDEVTDSDAVSVVDSEEKVNLVSRWAKFRRLGRLGKLLHFSRRRNDNISIASSYYSSAGSSGSPSSIRSTTTGEECLARPVVPPTPPENPGQKKKKQSRWRLRFRRASSPSEPDLEHGTTITIGHDSNEKPGTADIIIVTNPEPTTPVRPSSPAPEPTSPALGPTSPAPEPTSPVYEPTSPTFEPTSPTFEPTSPVYEPTSPTFEPTSPTFEPTSPTFEPSSPAFEPTSPTFEPTSPTFEPTSPTFEPSSPAFKPSSPTFEPSSPISELVGSTPNPVVDGEPSAPPPITVVPTPGTDNKPARSPLSIHIPPRPRRCSRPKLSRHAAPSNRSLSRHAAPSSRSAPGPINDPRYPSSPQEHNQPEIHRERRVTIITREREARPSVEGGPKLEREARLSAEERIRKNPITHGSQTEGSRYEDRFTVVDDWEDWKAIDDDADAADIPLPPSPSDEDFQRNEETKSKMRKEQYLQEAEERARREGEKAIEEANRKAEELEHARRAAIRKFKEEEHARKGAHREAEEEELARRAAAEAEYTKRQDELNARHRDEIERRRAEEEKEMILRERAELERRRRAIEDELEAKKQAEMEERRVRDLKGKGREEESNNTSKKSPIKFKDAVGRKFTFPFELVKTWDGMERLIKDAFLHVEIIGPHVQEGHYDLVDPEGEIILPRVWDLVVQPGWAISMHMWPLPSLITQPGPPGPPGPPPPPTIVNVPPPTESPWKKFDDKKYKKPARKSAKKNLQDWMEGTIPPRRMTRRDTDKSQRHGRTEGGRIVITDDPDEEMGWARALGSIVGMKPTVKRGYEHSDSDIEDD
ncbi:kinetoplast-associated KAP protein [Rutstroemia sp. NJR-2017a WRK4]|nr:kinetoplast-associated KAP protein [Rutstroemia sp. NJR-2017a WRK4]